MKLFYFGLIILGTLFLNTSKSFSQTNFIDGLIVTEIGDTLFGKIDFPERKKSPIRIAFIQRGSGDTKIFTPDDIRSFSVGEVSYESREVTIDLAPLEIIDRKTEILPLSLMKQVFLKPLIRGTTSLFLFENERVHFYLEEKGQIIQLVSNQYMILSEGKYQLKKEYEYSYREQLSAFNKSCSDNEISKVKYNSDSLVEFILKCHFGENSGNVTYALRKGKIAIKKGVMLGLGREFFNYGIEINEQETQPFEKEKAINTLLGIKLKFIFPKNEQKTSVSVSIDYTQLKFESDDYYRDFESLNFKTWYSAKSQAKLISPFYDIGISFSKKISDASNENYEPIYKVRPGYFVGAGLEIGSFYGVLRADLRPRGAYSTSNRTLSLLFGIEL